MVRRRDAVGRLLPSCFAVLVAVAMVLLTSGVVVANLTPESSHPPVKLSEVREGRLLIRDGRLERARVILEQARTTSEKEEIERLRLLGQVEMSLGMPGRAAERFEAILVLRPELIQIRQDLIRARHLSRNSPRRSRPQ